MANTLVDLKLVLDEALSTSQRLKKRQTFKRHKAKIRRGRERAKRRLAPKDKLETRASRQARKSIESKLLGGKTKADLPVSQRAAIEKKVEKRSAAIKRIAKRLFPQVKKAEVKRLKDFRAGAK